MKYYLNLKQNYNQLSSWVYDFNEIEGHYDLSFSEVEKIIKSSWIADIYTRSSLDAFIKKWYKDYLISNYE